MLTKSSGLKNCRVLSKYNILQGASSILGLAISRLLRINNVSFFAYIGYGNY